MARRIILDATAAGLQPTKRLDPMMAPSTSATIGEALAAKVAAKGRRTPPPAPVAHEPALELAPAPPPVAAGGT